MAHTSLLSLQTFNLAVWVTHRALNRGGICLPITVKELGSPINTTQIVVSVLLILVQK